MRIVLLGAPGAGKGTQCKRIVGKYGLEHLSSGDILRQERSAGSDLGKEAQSYMDSGALVPDKLIVDMMAGAIKKGGRAACSCFLGWNKRPADMGVNGSGLIGLLFTLIRIPHNRRGNNRGKPDLAVRKT